MNRWRKPVLMNGAIVACLLMVDLLTTTVHNSSHVPQFVFSGTLILLLVPINLVIGMVRNRDHKGDGPVYIALSGILLLIGFSVCSASTLFK